ncbi:hypothetical protein HanXRQr2_Chr07g0306701 [Helianthus annuus]|uniref:Uncharacterized protein n=1 Tax=Helianthus annuus TaxID=4232 RepID=A0A9K3INC2_HELAN|nr:hypothetical protein HanXRQr2_Chr07g0306701 [Helianthus annuus]KAJ0905691.1 hypothetical protein HanPSC8_Chr07g0296841 [Helianthus annuus]
MPNLHMNAMPRCVQNSSQVPDVFNLFWLYICSYLWQLSLYLTVHPHQLQKVPTPIYHFFRHRQRIEYRVFDI